MSAIERIEKLCASNGVSVTQMLKSTGLSTGIMSQWRGGQSISNKSAKKIADYFGVSASYILFGEENKKPPVAELREQLDDICKDLTEDKQRQLIDYAKFLRSKSENEE